MKRAKLVLILLLGLAPAFASSIARADAPVPPDAIPNIKSCADGQHVRITSAAGCFESQKAAAGVDGLWCSQTQPCGFNYDTGPKQFYWEEIQKIEVGHNRAEQGAKIGRNLALAGVVVWAIYLFSKKQDNAESTLKPFAALLLGVPIVFGSELAGEGIGSGLVEWKVCYPKSIPTPLAK